MKRKFKCIHCGKEFTLDDDDRELYEDGYFIFEPDTCDECMEMINNPPKDIDLFSDTDG